MTPSEYERGHSVATAHGHGVGYRLRPPAAVHHLSDAHDRATARPHREPATRPATSPVGPPSVITHWNRGGAPTVSWIATSAIACVPETSSSSSIARRSIPLGGAAGGASPSTRYGVNETNGTRPKPDATPEVRKAKAADPGRTILAARDGAPESVVPFNEEVFVGAASANRASMRSDDKTLSRSSTPKGHYFRRLWRRRSLVIRVRQV